YGHRSLVECPPGRLPVLWALTLVTAIGCCVLLPVRDWYTGTADRLLDSLWGVVFAVSIMASSLLVISMYQRFMARESRVGRYIADSAYWVYLVHFPLTLIMPLWIYSWPIPPTLKFGLVVVAVTALSLLSYHWCVRYTWIGAWLNGKKPLRKQAQAELMLSR
ncbi:MAG TPA: acyltransferase family protein, partial [Dongiaceae bacterium]|nr:acyltransferase family protein [Dongiaceae bacterium]